MCLQEQLTEITQRTFASFSKKYDEKEKEKKTRTKTAKIFAVHANSKKQTFSFIFHQSIQYDEASGHIFSNKLFARPDVFKKATFSYVFFIQRDILT